MNKKFFSLIKENAIHIAPKTKILPAKDFSALLNAAEVLELVQKDAESFKIEEFEEIEKIKLQAEKDGFELGFKSWAQAIGVLEEEIARVRAEVGKMIAPVALKAAKKIIGREIELSEDAIVDIVANSLKSVAQHKKITIYVNKKDLESLEKNRQRLRDLFENVESLSLRERNDIESGGCVIETEGGIINAQLENQWRVLEKAFETLLKPKKIAED